MFPLHDSLPWLPFMAPYQIAFMFPLHSFLPWLPFMAPYQIAFMFPVMALYQKGNAKR